MGLDVGGIATGGGVRFWGRAEPIRGCSSAARGC